jgi:hypothetical protein
MSLQAYSAELRAQASRLLESHPGLPHTRQEDGKIRFAASSADGFEVVLQPDSAGIIVFTSTGFHEHCDGPVAQAVQDALGLTRDLLSPDMRIREQLAGARPYRWHLERRHENGWAIESTSGSLFWNYFGHRTERIYQNHYLAGRLDRSDPFEP